MNMTDFELEERIKCLRDKLMNKWNDAALVWTDSQATAFKECVIDSIINECDEICQILDEMRGYHGY